MGLGSGIRKKTIPDPRSRDKRAPDPGSATLQQRPITKLKDHTWREEMGPLPGAIKYCATGKAFDMDQALQAGAMHGRHLRASMAGRIKRGRQNRDHAYLETLEAQFDMLSKHDR